MEGGAGLKEHAVRMYPARLPTGEEGGSKVWALQNKGLRDRLSLPLPGHDGPMLRHRHSSIIASLIPAAILAQA